MDLWTALRTIRRHWMVLLVGLGLTAVVVLALDVRIQQRYSATGTVVVISPGGNTNPINVYSSSSSLAASVATTLGNDDATKAAVAAEGGTSDYNLVTDPSLPVITITTTSPDPTTAVRSFGLLSQVINQLLSDRQRAFSSPPATTLEVLSVTSPTAAKVTSYKLTVLLIAAMLGGLVAIAFTFIADSAAQRRRLRSSQPHATPAPGPSLGTDMSPEKGGEPASPHASSRPARKAARRSLPPEATADSPPAQPAVAETAVAESNSEPLMEEPDPAEGDAEVAPTFQMPIEALSGHRRTSTPSYAEFLATQSSPPEEPVPEPGSTEPASPPRLRAITARRRPPRPR